jgi:hypothetical protein
MGEASFKKNCLRFWSGKAFDDYVDRILLLLLLFIKNELFCNQKVKLQKLLAT